MIRIGLTGVSGSGKSYVTKLFHQYGISSVNTDEVVHDLYSFKNPCTETLSQVFGTDILCADHAINRRKLASIVFASKEKLQLLNHTVHPFVIEKVNDISKEKENQGAKAFLIEAPQLFEAGLENSCDYVISVMSACETRIERLVIRDGITREMAEKRIASQHSDSFFRDHSDFCIENNDGDDLESQVKLILKEIGLLS